MRTHKAKNLRKAISHHSETISTPVEYLDHPYSLLKKRFYIRLFQLKNLLRSENPYYGNENENLFFANMRFKCFESVNLTQGYVDDDMGAAVNFEGTDDWFIPFIQIITAIDCIENNHFCFGTSEHDMNFPFMQDMYNYYSDNDRYVHLLAYVFKVKNILEEWKIDLECSSFKILFDFEY